MCGTCVTTFDAVSWNTAFGLAIATEGCRQVHLRLTGAGRTERAMQSWTENADFVALMGLDPFAVLGAPPAVPDDHDASVDSVVDDG